MRARYGRGRLQLVKWLIDPFVLVGVYLVLVVSFLDREGPSPGLSLACAVVPFHLMMMTIFNAIVMTQDRRSIILNLGFPRSLLPASSALTEAIGFSASLLLLALMMAVYAESPTWAIAWLPAVIGLTLVFTCACAYPAAIFGLWFPELVNFARSAVRALYFVSPGIVALAQIHGAANDIVRANPLTGIFEAYRDVLLYGHAPAEWMLLYPAGFALLLLALFVPLYRREEPHLAKVA